MHCGFLSQEGCTKFLPWGAVHTVVHIRENITDTVFEVVLMILL